MLILSKDHIEEIIDARLDFEEAGNKLVEVCERLIRPGAVLYWNHHDHIQSGIVIRFIGTAKCPDIKVENSKTGKIVSVDLHYVDWNRMFSQAENYAKEFKALEQVK